jgi:hypothetical protein
MDLNTYRREYADYFSAAELARYQSHAGGDADPRLESIRERYSDLWTRDAIDGLRRKLEDTSPHFETERAGLKALVDAACKLHVDSRTSEVADELARCEASARVTWEGDEMTAAEAARRVSDEPDAGRRIELHARSLNAARACDDLRAARLESLDDAARALGFESAGAMEEDATGAPLDPLAQRARKFLDETAHVYMNHLARWAAGEAQPVAARRFSQADALRFGRASRLDALLTPAKARAACRATFESLGVAGAGRRNVSTADADRPGKSYAPACFGVRPPEDVRLLSGTEPGADSQLKFFFEAGRAQHFAWVSRDMAARHPEFVHAPDASANDGAGHLLAGLLADARWAGERLGLRASEAGEFSRSVALVWLAAARRCAAGVLYALALKGPAGALSEQTSQIYAGLYEDATGFTHTPASWLIEAESARGCAAQLRAMLLAASLREHLRERHGRGWHASRAAGEELIDIWNTASRHRAEDLARLAWGGALDFDILADWLKAALDEG